MALGVSPSESPKLQLHSCSTEPLPREQPSKSESRREGRKLDPDYRKTCSLWLKAMPELGLLRRLSWASLRRQELSRDGKNTAGAQDACKNRL